MFTKILRVLGISTLLISQSVFADDTSLLQSTIRESAHTQAVSISDNFISKHISSSSIYGLKSIADDLHPKEITVDASGMKHVKYDQIHMGIPVYGAQLIAHIAADGSVVSTTGRTLKDIDVPSIPGISLEKAIKNAKKALRGMAPWKPFRKSLRKKFRKECRRKKFKDKCRARKLRQLRKAIRFKVVQTPDLMIYDAGFVLGKENDSQALIWKLALMNGSKRRVETLFINASTGEMILREDGVDHIQRFVLDCSVGGVGECGLDNSFFYVTGPGQAIEYFHGRSEGQPPRGPNPISDPTYNGSTDVDDAYDVVPNINNFYLDRFGLNGPNNQGGTGDGVAFPESFTSIETHANGGVSSSICQPGGFGLNPQGPVFCSGSLSYDALAHEYGHILTRITGLIGQGESGSVEEAFSDFMGEAFEYYMTGSYDWIVGTDSIEEIRDMANPTRISPIFPGASYAETYTSPDFYCGAESNNGTHINVSVLNKASYLMTDGGDFSGCTINGIGMAKVEQIWFQAVNNYFVQAQTMGPNDEDDGFYDAFNAACASLIGNHDIIASDCEEVQKAMQAVKLDQVGGCAEDIDRTAPATCAVVEPDPIQGDFDTDSDVDAIDYMVWSESFGEEGPALPADANGDEIVDGEDCAIWKSNYGAGVCPPMGLSEGPCSGSVSLFEADFDGDVDVDSDDYAIWAANYGRTDASGTSEGDANGDGAVDGADYLFWQQQVGLGSCETLSPVLNADLDGDMDIDADDLEQLKESIGVAATDGMPAGDLNNDGTIDVVDCELLRDSYAVGLCPPAGKDGEPCEGTSPRLYAGDGNFDGIVDSADYAVWRNNFGGTTSAGDYNGDSIVNAADYTVWRDLFGLGGCNVE